VRTVQVTERVPAPDWGRVSLGLSAGLAASYILLVTSALCAAPWVFAAAAIVVTAGEVLVGTRAPFAGWLAAHLGLGAPWRGLVRALAVAVLLARAGVPAGWYLPAFGGLLLVVGARTLGHALGVLVARRRKMPVVTRGVSLAPVRIPRAPHPIVGRHLDQSLSVPDLALLTGAAVAILTDSVVPLLVGTAVTVVALACAVGLLARAALAMRRVTAARVQAAVDRALRKVGAEVALYFGGGPEALYQLEMWVETLERLDVPSLIIVRDRESFRRLGPTRIPVLCVERGNVLMAQALPQLRLVLYVAHSVNNLHMLRRRGVRHVFIGHGDSDKPVTTNPFLKAYDEVWVSGPAARARFHGARLDLDERRVVEIGRPQLDTLVRRRPEPESTDPTPLTVLYAPTWEGYGDTPHQTSLGPCGITLVRLLLAEPDVRVLYRPHPLAGTRDPAVKRAHREILELLGAEPLPEPMLPAEPYTQARDDLDVATCEVQMSRAEQVAALEVWASKRLAYRPDGPRHLVVGGPHVSLYACFAVADVLLSDVSSVITDFLACDRPYGVVNPAGLAAQEFAVRYPASRGGYLVDPDGHGLAQLLAAGRGEDDPAAAERAALRERLLGPAEPAALERMRKAVAASVSYVG
jgi:hypothetical protein